jgi:hypothetical protein
VLDEKRGGIPQTFEDDVGRIEQSPNASIHRLSNHLDIQFKLKKRAYHLQVRDYLNETFRNMRIGRAAPKHWAPRIDTIRFLCLGLH